MGRALASLSETLAILDEAMYADKARKRNGQQRDKKTNRNEAGLRLETMLGIVYLRADDYLLQDREKGGGAAEADE